MNVALAFLRRDFLIWSSYRLAAVWQLSGIFLTGGLVYFAGTAIGERSDVIADESGSYVAFLLVGLAFMDVLMQGLASLPRAIGDNQRAGTFEPMLLAPITTGHMLVSFWLFRLAFSLVRMAVLLTFGIVALGFWHSANPLSVIAVFVPAQVAFLGIGALSASFIILVKQGDPVLLGYAALTSLLGGVFIPIETLPDWLHPVTALIPLTHALSGIREGLAGGSPSDVFPQIAVLTAMMAVLLPAGIVAFNWAMRRARMEGSLGEY